MDHPLFKRAFWLLVLIGILHTGAMFFYLYWTVWWSDIVMHFLGGLWVGLVSLWLYEMPEAKAKIGRGRSFLVALLAAIIVSAGWEVYEYLFDLSGVAASGYMEDTSLDFLMAALGSLSAVPYARRLLRTSRHERP